MSMIISLSIHLEVLQDMLNSNWQPWFLEHCWWVFGLQIQLRNQVAVVTVEILNIPPPPPKEAQQVCSNIKVMLTVLFDNGVSRVWITKSRHYHRVYNPSLLWCCVVQRLDLWQQKFGSCIITTCHLIRRT